MGRKEKRGHSSQKHDVFKTKTKAKQQGELLSNGHGIWGRVRPW